MSDAKESVERKAESGLSRALDKGERKRLRIVADEAIRIREQNFDPVYKEIAIYFRPLRKDWLDEPSGSAGVLDALPDPTILDDTGVQDAALMSQGIAGYSTNQGDRWFRLAPANRKLERSRAVSLYLEKCEEIIAQALVAGGYYASKAEALRDYCTFGQYDLHIGENESRDGIACVCLHPKRIGHMQSELGRITGIVRVQYMKPDELVRNYPRTGTIDEIREAAENEPLKPYKVREIIVRRKDGRSGGPSWKKPWASYVFLEGIAEDGVEDGSTLVALGGYESLPIIVARYETEPELPYGIGAAWYALRTYKYLLAMTLKRSRAADMLAEPPITANKKLKGRLAYLPRGITWTEGNEGESVHRLFDSAQLPDLRRDIEEARDSIHQAFYRDLFMMLMASERQMTALEVSERQGERVALLGPALGNAEEAQEREIARVWEVLAGLGKLPPPPPELRDADVKIEFLGLLSQMRKRFSRTTATMQALQGIRVVAEMWPSSLQNYDGDAISTGLADAYGMDQASILDEADVAETRQRIAAAQAEASAGEQRLEAAKVVLPNMAAAKEAGLAKGSAQ